MCVAARGCASTLETELPKLVGQPIDHVVAKMGLPTSEQTIMGRKVYVWTNSEQDVDFAPVFGGSRRATVRP